MAHKAAAGCLFSFLYSEAKDNVIHQDHYEKTNQRGAFSYLRYVNQHPFLPGKVGLDDPCDPFQPDIL